MRIVVLLRENIAESQGLHRSVHRASPKGGCNLIFGALSAKKGASTEEILNQQSREKTTSSRTAMGASHSQKCRWFCTRKAPQSLKIGLMNAGTLMDDLLKLHNGNLRLTNVVFLKNNTNF